MENMQENYSIYLNAFQDFELLFTYL
jgi:hypothetical protein